MKGNDKIYATAPIIASTDTKYIEDKNLATSMVILPIKINEEKDIKLKFELKREDGIWKVLKHKKI